MGDLNFNKTFPPDRDYLGKLLVCGPGPWTKEVLAEVTGIPTGRHSGKVMPMLAYGQYMGLWTLGREPGGQFTIHLSDLGQIIARVDPLLSEIGVQLILHVNLSGTADLWRWFFQSFGSGRTRLVMTEVQKQAMEQFRVTKVPLGPLKSTYLNESAFRKLDLLRQPSKDEVEMHPLRFFPQSTGYVASSLWSLWDRRAPGRTDLTLHEVTESLGWRQALNWDLTRTEAALQAMVNENLLRLERTMTPAVVTRLISQQAILNRYIQEQ